MRAWPLIRCLSVAGIIWAMAAGPIMAQSSDLKRLTLRQDLLGWEAVGRLELGSGSYCSGVLIAPDLVLTAAHCLAGRSGKPVDISKLSFRSGLRDGQVVAQRDVLRAVMHQNYRPGAGTSRWNLRHDAGLVQLAQAIPAATAAPFSVDRPRSASVSVVSYAQGRSEALSRQAVCKVLGHQSGLLAFDCDVTFGASGAPVFDTSNGRARIVSLVSQGARTEEQSLAFGMELPGVVDDLKLALRTGAGVFPKTEITARRLSIGNPAAADLGAKFVRP